MPIKVQEISVEEFMHIEAEWDALAERYRLPTLSHAWMKASLQSLVPGDTPRVVTLRSSDGELLGGVCLVETHNSRYLRFLGNYAVPEPTYLVAKDIDAERRIFRAIRSRGLPLYLDRVPVNLCDIPTLGGSLGPAALRIVRPEGGSPWLPLEGSWDQFESSLSAQRRSDLRRAARKASTLGPISFELAEPSTAEAPKMLQRYRELERNSWKYNAGTTIEQDQKADRFFSALTSGPLKLRFGFMQIGDSTVAGQIMADYGNKIWVLKTAFHQDFRSCSPGVLLMHEAIRSAFTLQRGGFEFLGFEEPWLSVWTRGVREYRTIRLYTYSARGASVLCHEMWESLKRRLRPAISLAHQS